MCVRACVLVVYQKSPTNRHHQGKLSCILAAKCFTIRLSHREQFDSGFKIGIYENVNCFSFVLQYIDRRAWRQKQPHCICWIIIVFHMFFARLLHIKCHIGETRAHHFNRATFRPLATSVEWINVWCVYVSLSCMYVFATKRSDRESTKHRLRKHSQQQYTIVGARALPDLLNRNYPLK